MAESPRKATRFIQHQGGMNEKPKVAVIAGYPQPLLFNPANMPLQVYLAAITDGSDVTLLHLTLAMAGEALH